MNPLVPPPIARIFDPDIPTQVMDPSSYVSPVKKDAKDQVIPSVLVKIGVVDAALIVTPTPMNLDPVHTKPFIL
jgi:hypothetical protein